MIDGVRMSVSSHSNSQSKSIRKEETHRPKSGEKKDVKVLVSEEECEIINVRSISFSTHVARSFVPLVLSRRFVTSSSGAL
jgi:hypothetical protein